MHFIAEIEAGAQAVSVACTSRWLAGAFHLEAVSGGRRSIPVRIHLIPPQRGQTFLVTITQEEADYSEEGGQVLDTEKRHCLVLVLVLLKSGGTSRRGASTSLR